MASGSTFKEISASVMKNVPAFVPCQDKLIRFRDYCDPLFAYQKSLENESLRLATLRDMLLTCLISGEINVMKIEI